MFSFTISEFTFICVGVVFVGSLILFPSFRQQLKALAGGFLQNFVQDTAKTPEGAKAIYAQKIDEATDKYNEACDTLQSLTGKLKTIKDQYAASQKRAEDFDKRARAAMSRNDEESATIFARSLQEEQDAMENLAQQYQKMQPAVEEMKTIKEKLEDELAALKRESKDVVSELQANQQISEAYSTVDKFRANTGTDKMLNATREGLQDSREKAAGAKVLYQSSREGKLDKANSKTADYKVNDYLDSLRKGASKPKSSGLNQTQSKK